MELLNGLLGISLYAAVIFCGILLFQAYMKKRLSPVLRFALWFVLIVRLAFPFTAETGFHLITLSAGQAVELPAPAEAVSLYEPASAFIENTGNEPVRDAAAGTGTEGKGTVQTANGRANAGKYSAEKIIFAVWTGGIAAVLAVMAACRVRIGRRIKRGVLLPDERIGRIFEACKGELGVRGKVKLRLCAAVASPALTVSVRPTLLLPLGLYHEEEKLLRHAFLHELTHYKRGDHIVRLVMNVLRAVWWFNPVVWLADKRLAEDMETACDSMVVRRMESGEKKSYAKTVLDLFSREREARYVLGMALGESRRIAEKRIRGIYMKQETKRGVKLAALILTGILGIACFTTACAPAQAADTQAVQPAGTGTPSVETAAQEAETGTQQAAKDMPRVGGYRKTGTWQETFETGNITVAVDADVLEFASGGIPDYESHPTIFTQEMADRAIEYFMGDAQLYEYGSRGASEEEGVSDDGKFREMPPPDPSIEDAGQCEQINVEATLVDGSQASLLIYNIEPMHESYLDFVKESKQETELSISKEDAAALALETADELGISPAYVFGIVPSDQQSGEAPRYDVVLSRCPQPAVWYLHTNGSDTAWQAEYGGPADFTDMAFMYGPEVIVVGVDDSGVVGFRWSAPEASGTAAGENAQTAPFEEVLQVFRDNIGGKTWVEPEHSATLYVDQVVLTMQRVLKEDGSYRTQPVWEFVGDCVFEAYEEGQERKASPLYGTTSLFTVNAVDGTVVDTVTHFMMPGPIPQDFGGWETAGEAEVQVEPETSEKGSYVVETAASESERIVVGTGSVSMFAEAQPNVIEQNG